MTLLLQEWLVYSLNNAKIAKYNPISLADFYPVWQRYMEVAI